MTENNTLVLETGLFEDAKTLREALVWISGASFLALCPEKMNETDWDNVLKEVMSVKKIIMI